MFEKLRALLPKEKTKEELNSHYEQTELEKGDLLAMMIAAFITFAPVILAVALVVVGIAYLFGL